MRRTCKEKSGFWVSPISEFRILAFLLLEEQRTEKKGKKKKIRGNLRRKSIRKIGFFQKITLKNDNPAAPPGGLEV